MTARFPRGLGHVAMGGVAALCLLAAAACGLSSGNNSGSAKSSIAARATVSATAAADWMSQNGYKTSSHLPQFAHLVVGARLNSPRYAAAWDTTGENSSTVATVVNDVKAALKKQNVSGVVITNNVKEVDMTATTVNSIKALGKAFVAAIEHPSSATVNSTPTGGAS